jgi:hypothetical protein
LNVFGFFTAQKILRAWNPLVSLAPDAVSVRGFFFHDSFWSQLILIRSKNSSAGSSSGSWGTGWPAI